jgi:hypothetical protein
MATQNLHAIFPLTCAIAACSAPHPVEREFDFGAAMKFEVLDSGYVLNGVPVEARDLRARISAAHAASGSGRRPAAVILMRVTPAEGEPQGLFELRRSQRREQALDDLRQAGVLDVHMGGPASRPTAEGRK